MFHTEQAAGATTAPPSVTQQPHPNCTDNDEARCFAVKNEDCFGIYEPWAHANCPFRCGFCDGKLLLLLLAVFFLLFLFLFLFS